MRFINLRTMTDEACISSPTVLCLGNFDGVHIGHRQLVDSVHQNYERLKASIPSLKRGAWFFDSNSYKSATEIYSLDEKLSVFSELGLDYAIIADFNSIRSLSPTEFVNDILIGDCKCVHAVCGENFRFGSRAIGDCSSLIELMGGNVSVIPLLSKGDTVVSSTYIRTLLSEGNILLANELLGEKYSINETVVHGKALGRTIGIPTINQYVKNKTMILKNGIYGTLCTIDSKKYFGVTNVGTRPTVEDDGAKNVETHIIDFNDDCYDKNVKVEFIFRIRDEMKFDSVESLSSQIFNDINTVRAYFYN